MVESVAIFLTEMIGSKVRHKPADFQLHVILTITTATKKVGMV